MKKLFKLKAMFRIAGVIALVALIGFAVSATFAACGDDSGPTGSGGGGGGGGARGTLTITGLPSGQWSVYVFSGGTDLSTPEIIASALLSNRYEAARRQRNNNAFPLSPSAAGQQVSGSYAGSGRKEIWLYDDGDVNKHATVNFSNGSATVPYSSFTDLW